MEEKRKNTFKTEEQIRQLEEFYNAGMTSYGKDHTRALELLNQAVDKTKLTYKQVKVSFRFQ